HSNGKSTVRVAARDKIRQLQDVERRQESGSQNSAKGIKKPALLAPVCHHYREVKSPLAL
ncbi:hypothetical protein ACV2ZF_30330, partial [Escherichia coli]